MEFDTDESAMATCPNGHQFEVYGAQTGDEFPCRMERCELVARV